MLPNFQDFRTPGIFPGATSSQGALVEGMMSSPQVIDPRAQYEQQSLLADALLANSQQYQGGGAMGALAMLANAYGAQKMGDRATQSLSEALTQESERAREALLAEQESERQRMEAEFNDYIRRKQVDQQFQNEPDLIRQMRAAGIDPNSPEGQQRILQGTGPQTSVNVQTGQQGPRIGTIPQDMQLVQDPETGAYRMEVIPGSETAREREDLQEKAEGAEQSQSVYRDVVLDDIGRALDIISEDPSTAAGLVGGIGAATRLGPGNRAAGVLESISSNVAFNRLDEMRRNSPTGGAVGQLTDKEREALAATMGSLRQTQHPDDLQFNLRRLNNLFLDAQHGNSEQRAALVESGQISPELNAQIEAQYMDERQTLSDADLINKYLQ